MIAWTAGVRQLCGGGEVPPGRRRRAEGWEWVDYAEEGSAKSHGRVEKRRCWQSGQLGWMSGQKDWKGLKIVILARERACEIRRVD